MLRISSAQKLLLPKSYTLKKSPKTIIINNEKRITLLFNKNVRREEMQASDELTPDYLIETPTILTNGKNFKSLVMDAKNYLHADMEIAENKFK